VKLLLLDERYPPELLAGFEVVREPKDDVVVALTVMQPVGEELFARLPALRVVGTASVGFDRIDVESAERRGIAVVSVPDYCTQEVADHALALLYALLRGIVVLDRDVARGGWDSKAAGPLRTLAELRVGIVGLGRIGGQSPRGSWRSVPRCSRTTCCRSSAKTSASPTWTSSSPSATR
jgi:Lactate dehydrogenase and related dehydrogenases